MPVCKSGGGEFATELAWLVLSPNPRPTNSGRSDAILTVSNPVASEEASSLSMLTVSPSSAVSEYIGSIVGRRDRSTPC